VILVLASLADQDAVAFAKEFADAAAISVLTCRDLAEDHTVLRYPDFASSTLTIDCRKIAIGEIEGVINVLPAVFPEELVFFPPEEREYQAAEFHALLTFLLSSLPCPVVNRPAAGSLSGPCLNPIGWYHLAQGLGIPVSPIQLDTDNFNNPFAARRADPTIAVTCLGDRVITESGTTGDRDTIALSRQAKVDYLTALYTASKAGRPELAAVRAVPDLRDMVIRRALIDYLRGHRAA
jgi:hypothetical protein